MEQVQKKRRGGVHAAEDRNPKSKIRVSVRLTPHLYQEIGRIASERYASRSLVIRSLLERCIEELEEYEGSDQRRQR